MTKERMLLTIMLFTVAIMLVSGKLLLTRFNLYSLGDAIIFLGLWGVITRVSHLLLLKVGTYFLSKS